MSLVTIHEYASQSLIYTRCTHNHWDPRANQRVFNHSLLMVTQAFKMCGTIVLLNYACVNDVLNIKTEGNLQKPMQRIFYFTYFLYFSHNEVLYYSAIFSDFQYALLRRRKPTFLHFWSVYLQVLYLLIYTLSLCKWNKDVQLEAFPRVQSIQDFHKTL